MRCGHNERKDCSVPPPPLSIKHRAQLDAIAMTQIDLPITLSVSTQTQRTLSAHTTTLSSLDYDIFMTTESITRPACREDFSTPFMQLPPKRSSCASKNDQAQSRVRRSHHAACFE